MAQPSLIYELGALLEKLPLPGAKPRGRPDCDPNDHVAFAEVKLSDTREAALKQFNAAVRAIPEVEECHMIASSFDYLLKVRTIDIRRYRIVLGEKISSLPHVASTSTFVAMETISETTT